MCISGDSTPNKPVNKHTHNTAPTYMIPSFTLNMELTVMTLTVPSTPMFVHQCLISHIPLA
jgi:hypothetical protein